MGTDHFSRRTFLSAAAVAGLGGTLLSACGGDDSGDGDGGGQVSFEWWNIATTEPTKSLFPQLARAYEQAHPNVKIKDTPTENEAFKSKMTAQTASGKLPDIFQTWGGGVLKQQIDAGLVENLTDKMSSWSGQLTPVSLQPYQFDGQTYAVPYDIGMVGFWYNKALFQKARISAVPKTWAEFLEAIRALRSAGITPIALAGKEKWPGHYYWAYLVIRVGGVAAMQQAAAAKDFTGTAFIQAGQRLKELVDLTPFQQGVLGASYEEPGGSAATFGNGKAGMELMGQWHQNVQKAVGKGLGNDLGFFPFPTVEGGQGAATEAFGGGGGFAVRKGAPDAALDFLKFLSVTNQSKLVQANILPVVKGAEASIPDPNQKAVATTLAGATGFQLFLDQAFPPAVGQEVNDSTADLIAGKKSPEQVAESVTKVAKTQ